MVRGVVSVGLLGALLSMAFIPLAAAEEDPYYLRINVYRPEAPRSSNGEERCTPTPLDISLPVESVAALLNAVQNVQINSIERYMPRCVAASTAWTTPTVSPGAFASWNVTSGYYYLEVSGIPLESGLGLPAPRPSTVGIGGRAPVGAEADCVDCPPVP